MKRTEKQSIADRVKEYVGNKESQRQAAATLRGVSSATLSQIINGKWELISDEMWRTVAAQVGYDADRWVLVETEGYIRMYNLMKDAQLNHLCMAVTGDAGCGKSQAIRSYADRNRNVLVLSCSEYWNRKYFLTELLKAMGVESAGSTVVDMMSDAVYHLKRRDGVLLVLDEADKLSDQVLYFFITLYNQLEDHVGILLCATEYLKKRIDRGVKNNRKGYREIYSRVGRKFIPMSVVCDGDIESVCRANGVTHPEDIEDIVEECDCDLRRVKRLVHAIKQDSNAD